ncbi:MAG: KEOPS complex kinase/ATPase Bud32 [Candidatus Micrarchaeota archaeon]
MKSIGKGAEAELYKSNFLGKGIVVKERICKKYRIMEIDVPLRRTRTKNEARLLSAAKKAMVPVPTIYEIGTYNIFMSRIDGKLLRDLRTTPFLLRKAGEYLARLHKSNIVHGDYTTANLMVDSDGKLYVIDFGLGSLSKDLEDKAVDILLMKKSLDNRVWYREFLKGYARGNREYRAVLKQLEEVERRGRYVVRAMQG